MSSRNPYSLREIFDLITMELIESLRRTFSRHQAEQLKEGFQWEQWQRAKLRSLAAYRRENAEIVGRNRKAIFDVITEVLDTSFDDGRARAEREILQVLFPEELRGRGPDAPAPPESQFFKMNKEKLQALQETVIGDMEKAQHAVLRKMDDVYRQTIFRAQVHMSSGAKTLNQAVDMATQEFLDKGIQCIEYKDGRRVNVSSYAEMALRTASQRATFMGEGTKRNEWGVHTIVVSAHATSCDLCVPWQARVLIDDVYSDGKPDGQYPLLSTAMKAGLLHPNCRHTLSTFFPGVSRLPKSVDEETARRNYEAEQRQRAIERQIRRWKRREVGSLDSENSKEAEGKVKEWQEKMREHMETNPQLRRNYWRERPAPGVTNTDVAKGKSMYPLTDEEKIAFTRSLISSKVYNLRVKTQKQKEHILGDPKWKSRVIRDLAAGKSPPGAFLKGTDVQILVDEFAGKGIIEFKKNADFPREYVDADGVIGRAYIRYLNRYIPTSRFAIHYSSTGVHAFPIPPRR